MEAELRTMLMAAICDESERDINLAEAIRRRFRRFGGIELETHPAAPVRKPPALDP